MIGETIEACLLVRTGLLFSKNEEIKERKCRGYSQRPLAGTSLLAGRKANSYGYGA